jgi:hypothetical protein
MEKINQEVMVSEFIKEIPNFSRYLCDIKEGKIYRKPTETTKGKWLKPKPNHIGYVMTTLKNDQGEFIRVLVHEVVMSAAIEHPKSFWTTKNLEIDHKDRNKSNNDFDNLWLRTKKQNHENIENRKASRMLNKDEVNYIFEQFEKWNGRKVKFYYHMAKEIGCVWQTIQYTILGYSNSSKRD